MKVILSVEQLAKRISQLSAVLGGDQIYGYIKLSVQGTLATLTASDVGASLEIQIPFKSIAEPGQVLLPAKRLKEIVDNMPGDKDLTLETVDATKVRVKSGKHESTLNTESVGNFPAPAAEDFTFRTTVAVGALRSLAEKIVFAVPENDGKYTVTTAKLESQKTHLTAVATDGVRLAVARVGLDTGVEFALQLPKTALELLKTLEGDQNTRVYESEGTFQFVTGPEESPIEKLLIHKTSGTFPPYEKVIPKTYKTRASFATGSFSSALNRTLPLAEKEMPGVIFSVEENGPALLFKADSAEAGMAMDDIEVTVAGPAATVKLRGDYVKQFVEHAGGELTMDFGAPNGAIVFHSGPDYTYVIMPLLSGNASASK